MNGRAITLEFLDDLERLNSVHDGHLNVHEYQIECLCSRQFNGFLPCTGDGQFNIPGFGHGAHDQLVGHDVFNIEEAQTLERGFFGVVLPGVFVL